MLAHTSMASAFSAARIDPVRFDVLAEDINHLRALPEKERIPTLLSWGWRAIDLHKAPCLETRRLMAEYEATLDRNEIGSIIALLLALAGSTLILLYGLAGPALRGTI
ncbi:MAG: hypothetical protein LCH39_01885 [Proteobacteria bacterium]|nr:hypothetical protein [Pseudomonadota bacterium]